MRGTSATLVLRYLAYLAFAFAALIFWALYAMLVLGIFPFPVEPACIVYGTPCPEPALIVRILKVASIWLAIPLTVLVFIFYRRFIRRRLGYDD